MFKTEKRKRDVCLVFEASEFLLLSHEQFKELYESEIDKLGGYEGKKFFSFSESICRDVETIEYLTSKGFEEIKKRKATDNECTYIKINHSEPFSNSYVDSSLDSEFSTSSPSDEELASVSRAPSTVSTPSDDSSSDEPPNPENPSHLNHGDVLALCAISQNGRVTATQKRVLQPKIKILSILTENEMKIKMQKSWIQLLVEQLLEQLLALFLGLLLSLLSLFLRVG